MLKNEDLIRLKEDMLLFIESLLKGDYGSFKLKLAIVGVMWLFVFVAICVDLISGYSKAKQRGDARTSYGLKRTVSKFTLYYSCLLFAFMIDVIIMYILAAFNTPIPAIPYITLVGSAYLLYVEARSVMEKAEDKEKIRLSRNLDELLTFIENKEDVIKAISETVRKIKEKEESNDLDQ
jgi:Holin family.